MYTSDLTERELDPSMTSLQSDWQVYMVMHIYIMLYVVILSLGCGNGSDSDVVITVSSDSWLCLVVMDPH